MNNQVFLDRFSDAVDALLAVAGSRLANCSETSDLFSINLNVSDFDSLSEDILRLAPYSDILSVYVDFDLRQGNLIGSAKLETKARLVIEQVNKDSTVSIPPVDQDAEGIYQALMDFLLTPGTWFFITPLVQKLSYLSASGIQAEIELRIAAEKAYLKEQLHVSEDTNCLVYISAEKLNHRLKGSNYTEIDAFNKKACKTGTLILLGDANGKAGGANLRVIGRDRWKTPAILELGLTGEDAQAISKMVKFRKEECNWDISPSELTPYHFHLETNDLSYQPLVKTLHFLCSQACLTHLGTRTVLDEGRYCSEFRSYKRFNVRVPTSDPGLDYQPLFDLFSWAYENLSSDKLEIVRQVICPQLGPDREANFIKLVCQASNTIKEAKNNFSYYLRATVEAYFDKRLKVIEFLQKFSDDTGSSVSKLTRDLIGDLYKTIGVVIGVVLAYIVDPKVTPTVVYWTSLIYMVYIAFIVFYALPSTYSQYAGKVKDYRFNIGKFSTILTEEEIEQIHGKPYARALWFFRVYFGVTEFLYMLLGGLAWQILSAVSGF